MLKFYFKIFIQLLLTIFIWATLTVDIKATELTVFIALILATVLGMTINSMVEERPKFYAIRYLFLLPPFLLLLYFIIFIPSAFLILNITLHPLLWICLLILISLNSKKWLDFKSPTKRLNLIYIFSVVFIYSMFFFPKWSATNKYRELDSFKKKKVIESTLTKDELPGINIKDYEFVNWNGDSIQIKNFNYTIIETWNENCPPCLIAFKELPEIYEKYKDDLEVIYLYESKDVNFIEDIQDVYSFKPVPNKDKILIDANQKLYIDLKMQGYPYFLLFDKEGNLLLNLRGYNQEQKQKINTSLDELISK